jgi:hypothetical protein
MPIVKIKLKKRPHPFVIIDKRALDDARLPWSAKGLHAHLLCRPDDWHVVFENLLKQAPDGRYALRAALNSLKKFGYARLQRTRDRHGRIRGSSWIIYECPITEMLVFPLSVKPDSRKTPPPGKDQNSDKSDATNNEYPSTPTNNDKASKRLLALDGELELLGQISEILGKNEMERNGGMWRKRIRGGAAERRALRNAIEDYKVITPDQRRAIRNVPAWFTVRYQRNLVKISETQGDCLRTL